MMSIFNIFNDILLPWKLFCKLMKFFSDVEKEQSSEKLVLPEIPSADAHLTKFPLQEIVKNVEFLYCQVDELTETLPESQQSIINYDYDYVLKVRKLIRNVIKIMQFGCFITSIC